MIECKRSDHGNISNLPSSFCSPFTKGQVIALDFGKEGEKNNANDIPGDYNNNRLWLILNVPEFNNVCDARIVCVPLNSLEGKMESYVIKDKKGKTEVSYPTSNLYKQVLITQPDRIVFNSFNTLVMLRMTQIKSFPIREILNKFRHAYFVPQAVMDTVDEYNKQLFGYQDLSKDFSNIGSVNRVGYEIHYSHMDSTNPNIIRIKDNKKPAEVKQQKPKEEPKAEEKKTTKSKERNIVIHPQTTKPKAVGNINIRTAVPSIGKLLRASNHGETTLYITNRFNQLIPMITNEFTTNTGRTLHNITQNDVNVAIKTLGITFKKNKKRKLVPSNKITDVYNTILNSEYYWSNKNEEEPAKEEVNEEPSPMKAYRERVAQDLKEHMGRKKTAWTFKEASKFLTLYSEARCNGEVSKFDALFHFDTVKQASYLRTKFGFKLKRNKSHDDDLYGYVMPNGTIANELLCDTFDLNDNIIRLKYSIANSIPVLHLAQRMNNSL